MTQEKKVSNYPDLAQFYSTLAFHNQFFQLEGSSLGLLLFFVQQNQMIDFILFVLMNVNDYICVTKNQNYEGIKTKRMNLIKDAGMWATGMLMIYDTLSRNKKEVILMRAKIVNTAVNEKQVI